MGKPDYIVEINGIHDRRAFFSSVLSFFAPVDVILTTWGKLPSTVDERLSPFRTPCLWLRRLFFHEANWQLNQSSLQVLLESLCVDELLNQFTWGIHKGNTPLVLCGHWEKHVIIEGSDLVDEKTLLCWVKDLKVNKIIESYEKITN